MISLLEQTTEYWVSPAGLRRRLEMLGEGFSYQLVNNALQIYGVENEVWGYEWVSSGLETMCAYCDSQSGRQYQIGQFLPRLPAHGHCACEWRLIPKRL